MTSVMSSALMTAPEGFDGELRMITFVRGVINCATISAVTRNPCDSSDSSSTQFPPA